MSGSVVAPGVHAVGADSVVLRSVLGAGASIGVRCTVTDAVVGDGAQIGADNEPGRRHQGLDRRGDPGWRGSLLAAPLTSRAAVIMAVRREPPRSDGLLGGRRSQLEAAA